MDVLESLKVERIKLIHRQDELKQEKLSMMNKIDLQIEEIESYINEINGAILIVKYIVDKYQDDEEVVCPSCLGLGKFSKANIKTGCTETIECLTCGGTGYIKKGYGSSMISSNIINKINDEELRKYTSKLNDVFKL